MPSKDTKILEFNEYWKSDNTPPIIYADLKSLIKTLNWFKNNFVKPSPAKAGGRTYSISMIKTFDGIENKHDVFRGKDCKKKFCESLTL